jgi:hypothetical protein
VSAFHPQNGGDAEQIVLDAVVHLLQQMRFHLQRGPRLFVEVRTLDGDGGLIRERLDQFRGDARLHVALGAHEMQHALHQSLAQQRHRQRGMDVRHLVRQVAQITFGISVHAIDAGILLARLGGAAHAALPEPQLGIAQRRRVHLATGGQVQRAIVF